MTRPSGDPQAPEHGVRGELREDRYLGGQDLTAWRTPVGRWLSHVARRLDAVIPAMGPYVPLALTLLVGCVAMILLVTGFAEVYEAVTDADGVAALDQPLLDAALAARTPWLDEGVTLYTDIGGKVGMPVLAVAVMTVLAVRRRSWTPVILITTAGVGSLLMTVLGKDLFGRARPPLLDAVPPYELSPSFPSGHTLNATVIAGVVAYLLILRRSTLSSRVLIVAAAAAFAVSMGLSRVFLGHHWFTDVLAAWALGCAWVAVVVMAHRLYLTARARPPAGASPAPLERRPS